MKYIQAIIAPNQLDPIIEALAKQEIFRLTVSEVMGTEPRRAEKAAKERSLEPDLLPRLQLEIAVNDYILEQALEAIQEGSEHSGQKPGKVFVFELEDAIRIRTGEHGSEAI